MYTCKECLEEKPSSEYYTHKNGGRKSAMCKPCYLESRKEYNAEWRIDNKDYVKETNTTNYNSLQRRELHYKKEYNITLEDYDTMYEAQGGKCKICGTEDPKTPKNGRFCVDHNHETGEVRGLLCSSCNRGIGLLQDNPDVILSAYKYLTQKW